METNYFIRVKDTSGTLLSEFSHFLSLNINHRVNGSGYCQIQLDGGHSAISLFDRDSIVEVWRSVPDLGITTPYKEWEGLHRTQTKQTFSNGRKTFSSYSQGFLDLLSRRVIGYRSGAARAGQSGVAETVMKNFVDQNAGALATTPTRITNGVTTGLIIAADQGRGSTWSGERSFKNLLEVLQEVSDDTNMFFDVFGWGGVGASFLFEVYPNVRGLDRRAIAINPITGLNSAGNAPAVFALNLGNVQEAVLSENANVQVTSVFALGQGEGADRQIVNIQDAPGISESPWNLREVARNASSEDDAVGLTKYANAELNTGKVVSEFNFEVLQTAGSLYGLHYYWGDYVTGRYDTFEQDKYIIGSQVIVNQDGESVTLTLADIP
jgi:hypothetical protein